MAASMRKEKITFGEQFQNFLRVLNDNFKSLRSFCDRFKERNLEVADPVAPYVEKAEKKIKELEELVQTLQQSDAEEIELQTVYKCLRSYAMILLDVTYCEETTLVDTIFPENNSKSRVHRLLSMLGQPERVCQHCLPDIPAKETLGEEIMECLLWRRGALLYMYCHTINEQEFRRKHERPDFLWGCERGVQFMQNMMKVREPISGTKEELNCKDDFTYNLLLNGIYSDTHILSLVYTAEMCYWFIKEEQEATNNQELSTSSSDTNSATPQGASSLATKSQVDQETLEKIQARKKVEAKRKGKKGRARGQTAERSSSMEDLLLPGFTSESAAEPLAAPKGDSDSTTKPFDAWNIGQSSLKLYMSIATGMNGWGHEQAAHLLSFFDLEKYSNLDSNGSPSPASALLVDSTEHQSLEG